MIISEYPFDSHPNNYSMHDVIDVSDLKLFPVHRSYD